MQSNDSSQTKPLLKACNPESLGMDVGCSPRMYTHEQALKLSSNYPNLTNTPPTEPQQTANLKLGTRTPGHSRHQLTTTTTMTTNPRPCDSDPQAAATHPTSREAGSCTPGAQKSSQDKREGIPGRKGGKLGGTEGKRQQEGETALATQHAGEARRKGGETSGVDALQGPRTRPPRPLTSTPPRLGAGQPYACGRWAARLANQLRFEQPATPAWQ